MIGFTCSTFDLLHAGHVKMLEDARSHCDELWVGLQTGIPDRPEKNQPCQTVYERWCQLEACKWVDKIIPYESEADLLNLLRTIPAHTRFIGEEYMDLSFTGRDIYETYLDGKTILSIETRRPDCKIVYTSRTHTWSTTDLRKRASINSQTKQGN